MRSILVVDDDPDIRSLLSTFLAEEGQKVHLARDGYHALHLLDKIDVPALILLDYKMPEMNGAQFLTELRRHPRLQSVPVVILSGWTREWTGVGLETVEVLSKPVDLGRLRDVVTRYLGTGEPSETSLRTAQ